MAFELVSVESTAIDGLAYNRKTGTLVVKFVGGSRYYFHGVPPKRYDEFATAESKGRYFSAMIRENYTYSRHHGKNA